MKESYYFPHDYNAKSDQKMLILRGEYGLEGYALFFMILEDMAQDTYGYLNRVAIGGLSIGYGVPKEKTTEIINFCIDIGLFCEDKNGIYSKRMLEHKTYRKDLSEAGKQGAKKRWENRGAISHPISTPNAKERKGKEIEDIYISEKKQITDLLEKEYIQDMKGALKIMWDLFIEKGYNIKATTKSIEEFMEWIKKKSKTTFGLSQQGDYLWDKTYNAIEDCMEYHKNDRTMVTKQTHKSRVNTRFGNIQKSFTNKK